MHGSKHPRGRFPWERAPCLPTLERGLLDPGLSMLLTPVLLGTRSYRFFWDCLRRGQLSPFTDEKLRLEDLRASRGGARTGTGACWMAGALLPLASAGRARAEGSSWASDKWGGAEVTGTYTVCVPARSLLSCHLLREAVLSTLCKSLCPHRHPLLPPCFMCHHGTHVTVS